MSDNRYASEFIKVAVGSGEPTAQNKINAVKGEVRGIKIKILPPRDAGDLATVEVGNGLHICGCCEWKKRAVIKKVTEMLQWYLDQEKGIGPEESTEEMPEGILYMPKGTKVMEFEENPEEGIGELPTEIVKEENTIAKRNRAIKKALSREFGRKNVRVRGGRGTAYGWVDVTVTIPVPDDFQIIDDGHYTKEAKEAMDRTRNRVIEILKKEGLWDQLGIWYDDDPDATMRKKITIDARFGEEY